MREFYDNTMVSGHRKCSRKYYFRHVQDLQPVGTAAPLVFGLSWHGALDVVYDKWGTVSDTELTKQAFLKFNSIWVEWGYPSFEDIDEADRDNLKARTPDTALEMLQEYITIRRPFLDNCQMVAIEKPFVVPLLPDEDKYWYCGRLDKVVRRNDGIYIIDHKTTTAYKKEGGFRSTFTDSFSPDSQMDGYAYAGKMLYGDDFKGIYIDGALVHKFVHDKFCLIPVSRGIDHLDAWLWETLEEVSRIKEYNSRLLNPGLAMRDSHLEAFPKSTGACYDFGSMCAYADLCKGYGNPHAAITSQGKPPGFDIDKWEPFELNHLQEIGIEKD